MKPSKKPPGEKRKMDNFPLVFKLALVFIAMISGACLVLFLRKAEDKSNMMFTLVFVGLIAGAYLAFFLFKPSTAEKGVKMGGMSLLKTLPVILAGFAMAGLLQALIPRASLVNWLGAHEGIKGVLLGALLGAITPGPIVVPLAVVAGLAKGGAGMGSMLAYLVAWDVIAVRKVPMTVAFWGNWRLAAVKCAIGLPVTILAGVLANWIFPNAKFLEPK